MESNEALRYLQERFIRVCTNWYSAKNYKTNEPTWYKRGDLWQWAQEAYERGEDYFYAEPVDHNNPNGKLRLCEPHYEYKFVDTLSEEEYKNVFKEGLSQEEILESLKTKHGNRII